MPNVFLPPSEYLPHKAPMIILDEVIDATEDTAKAVSYVTENSVLKTFLNDNGDLPSFYALELFSQTVGIWSGYRAKQMNLQIPPMGMVLGGRDISCKASVIRNGAKIITEVKMIMSDNSIASFDGTLYVNDEIFARGKVNVISVTHDDLIKLFKRD